MVKLSLSGCVVAMAAACQSAAPAAQAPASQQQAPAATTGAAPAAQGTSAPPVAGAPVDGGYLKQQLPYSASNIDPHTTDDVVGYYFIARAWYEPLFSVELKPGVDWRVGAKVVPFLAESWKQDNPTTYTVSLRRGVKFHNGDELTARDVVFSYKRLTDPNVKVDPAIRQYVDNLEAAEQIDDYTLRLASKKPDADFLFSLAQSRIAIASQRAVESGIDLSKQAVGTGPFRLTRYQKDAEALAERFDGYWQRGYPHLSGIKMVLKADDAAMTAAFIASQTDILMRNDRKQFDPILQANPRVQYEQFTANNLYHLMPNLTRPPLTDERVRRAIHLALNRQEINQAVNFGEGVITGPIVIMGKEGWTIGPDELLKLPGYRESKAEDLAEAKRLLDEAGMGGGLRLGLAFNQLYSISPAYAQVVQAQLKPLNIALELQPYDNATFYQKRVASAFDLALSVDGVMEQPAITAWAQFHSSGVFSKPAGISDPELDKLIETQAQEFDENRRGALFQQIQKLVNDRVYQIPLPLPRLYAGHQPWIHDWVDNRSSRQSILNPWAIWMDVSAAPGDRRQG
jgi:peptide/nickel transport system substrate-binding protein